MESPPLLPTINLIGATAFILVKTFYPDDVPLIVSGASPSSLGCTSNRSTRASKAPIDAPPISLTFTRRVCVMVRPALSYPLFDAKRCTFNAEAADLFSNAICIPS